MGTKVLGTLSIVAGIVLIGVFFNSQGQQYGQEKQSKFLVVDGFYDGPSRTANGETVSFYSGGERMMFNMHLEDVTEEMLRKDFELHIKQFKLDKAKGYPDSWVTKVALFFHNKGW